MEKIAYRETTIDDFKDYRRSSEPNREIFTNYLFNGSRRGVIDEDIEELSLFNKEVYSFVLYLKENLHAVLDDMGVDKNERYERIRFLYRIDFFEELSDFEYGDFYLTDNFLCAMEFSRFSAGELCELAYQCISDIKKNNIVFQDEQIQRIMDKIIRKHEEYGKTEKVVLAVRNVEFDDLRTEKGSEYKGRDHRIETLYEGEVSLTFETTNNVRLRNLSKYCFYLIPESRFRELIPVFTDIKEDEVDKIR